MAGVIIAKGGTVFTKACENMRRKKMQKILDRIDTERGIGTKLNSDGINWMKG
jgi:hypothetical protein